MDKKMESVYQETTGRSGNENMDAILDEASKHVGAENTEVFMESWDEDSVEFEMDRFKQVLSQNITGYALRLIKDDKLGFSCGTVPESREMTKRAVSSAEFGPPAKFKFPDKSDYPAVKNFDNKIKDLSLEEMVSKGKEIHDYLKSRLPEYQYDVYLNRYIENRHILSGKIDSSFKRTMYNFAVSAYLFKEGDFFSASENFSCSIMHPMEHKIADDLLGILELAKREATISTGMYTAVLSPNAFQEILMSVLVGLNGRLVEKGSSPLAGKIGEQIFPESVNICDDGTIEGNAATAPFDDEGIPISRKPLFEKGVLKRYMLDLSSAASLGMEPTGNAQRSYCSMPRPASHAIGFGEGDMTEEELLKDIKEGIYIDQLIGGHTGNIYSGDFQLSVDLGFKIENGEKTGRVKNVMIAGNIYKIFADLSGISKTRKWVSKYYLPHVRFDSLSVASR